MLKYKGSQQFRQRILLSTLSGRPLRIDDIRSDKEEVGLRDFEACFLRLIEKITNGCEIVINETGTGIRYRPGIVVGGNGLVHDCGCSRSVGYFIQPLLMLAPFGKQDLDITLRGITNGLDDVGADVLRTVSMPMMRNFGIGDGAKLQISKRGAPPLGGGEVVLQVPLVRQLLPIHLVESGKVKRVRGVAYATKVSPQVANRMIDGARAILNHFLPDVWIYSDIHKGKSSGNCPGFSITLVAETTEGHLLAAELTGSGGTLPEDVGAACAEALLEEVRHAGVVDSCNQSLMLSMMCLSPEDVSTVRLGQMTPFTVETLRLVRDFFGVTFQIDPDARDGTLLVSCRGVGFKNLSKRTT